ncbi:sensor histidine kinase [Chloroflexota bacterium]
MNVKNQRSAYELLGAYRGFALAVAAVQVVLVMPAPNRLSSYLILGALGVYSLAKVLLAHYRGARDGYLWLGVDVLLCTPPLFLTGGLTSPFLLYSLCPVIYAALVFPRWIALGGACFASISLVASLFLLHTSPVNFGFAGIYIIAGFLIAIMPYTTNLNIYRRLEEDAALKERRRLARQLHDTVVQALAYVNLKASLVTDTLAQGNLERSLKELGQMKESLDSTYDEVRRTIDTLGRPSPETVEFVPALSHRVKEFSRKCGLKSLLSVNGGEFKLSPQAADELLHIVGEAMVNAGNHAQATALRVAVNKNGNRVKVNVKDNGRGFDLPAYSCSEKAQNHHGITIMRERAESMGGEIAVNSALGKGTEVSVTLPLE